MFLLEKDGKYAGEIREFPPEVARALLDAGRAVNPYAEPAQPSTPSPSLAGVSRPPTTAAAPKKLKKAVK